MSKTIRHHKLPNGIEIAYDSKANLDMLCREIFDGKIYAANGISVAEGDCIVDIGANIGFFILLLNQQLKSATVYGFEPIPATFELLKINTAKHNHLDLKLFQCGLSKAVGKATFHHFPLTSIASTMYPQSSSEYQRDSRRFVLNDLQRRSVLLRNVISITPEWLWYPITEIARRYFQRSVRVECELDTLTNVIARESINRIDLLKIDTEGAEHDILASINDADWKIIRQIIVEVHDGRIGLDSVLSLLQSKNFRTTHVKADPTIDGLFMVYGIRI